MKKLMFAMALVAAGAVFADEAAPKETEKQDQQAAEQAEKSDAPLFSGYINTGLYSGYQLYGNLVNSEPVVQTYAELLFNIPADLGSIGVGFWCNNDLTDKRHMSYGKAFNEQDYIVQYKKFFSFNDKGYYDPESYGLLYKTWVIWYYYPHHRGHGFSESTATTMDWNHYFEFKNPFVTPYVAIVHEYHESDANLIQFGAKKTLGTGIDGFTVTPSVEFVWRNSNYNWCFPTAGFTEFAGSSLATMKIGLDADYWFNEHFGLFAKVAYCHILDHDLRRIAEDGSGADYSQYKDFAWGGIGVQAKF